MCEERQIYAGSRAALKRNNAVQLRVDRELLADAKRRKLDLSRVFEAALTATICEMRREEWLNKNRAALEAYNAHVERDGVFSDGLRLF
jgi:antitoxin CcdA